VLETRLGAGVRDLVTSTSDDAILKSLRLVGLLFWCFIRINVMLDLCHRHMLVTYRVTASKMHGHGLLICFSCDLL
jgi:hypothetical protein